MPRTPHGDADHELGAVQNRCGITTEFYNPLHQIKRARVVKHRDLHRKLEITSWKDRLRQPASIGGTMIYNSEPYELSPYPLRR
jgi:hypothetical protein